MPVFKKQNIIHIKIGSICFNKDGNTKRENYVVFDSYKRVAAEVAIRFGQDKYKEAFIGVEVHARNYKTKARILLEWGKVITGVADRPAIGSTSPFYKGTEARINKTQTTQPQADYTIDALIRQFEIELEHYTVQ